MANAKEKCFEEAVDKLNEGRAARGVERLQVAHRKTWIRDFAGNWEQAPWSFQLMGQVKRAWRTMNGILRGDPNYDNTPVPSGDTPAQWRTPDVTLTRPGGQQVVLDTKFDRLSGGRDRPGRRPGLSGTTQEQDIDDLNRKLGNGVTDPYLNPTNCKCSERKLETEKIQVEVPADQFSQFERQLFERSPSGRPLPEGQRAPGGGRAPGVRIPGGIRIPIPVW